MWFFKSWPFISIIRIRKNKFWTLLRIIVHAPNVFIFKNPVENLDIVLFVNESYLRIRQDIFRIHSDRIQLIYSIWPFLPETKSAQMAEHIAYPQSWQMGRDKRANTYCNSTHVLHTVYDFCYALETASILDITRNSEYLND